MEQNTETNSHRVFEIDFQKLREHAKANRWTCYQIARATRGVASQPMISKLFNGSNPNPTAVKLKAICDVIDFPIQNAFKIAA